MSDVPHLRFPEFTGEWKKYRLDEMGESFIGLTYSPKDVVENEGTIVFRSSNIQNGQIDYSDIVRVSKTIKERIITRENDLLICARNGSPRLIGKNALIKKTDANNTFGAFMMVYRSIDNDFIHPLLSTRRYVSQVGENLGARINQITTSDLNSFEFFFPKNDGEKRKIGKLFDLLNERIATQNKIIDKLKSLIKGLAVALTTKGKPNTAISQCLECHSSALQESEVIPNGLYKVFGANGLVGYTDVPQMNGDAILVIKDGSGVGTVFYAQGKFSAIGTLSYLTVIGNNDLRYLYFALSVFNFQAYKTGMAIPHIYFKDYGKAKIYCPPFAEQKHIANALDKLESKLLLEQGILASFNWQKRYLLGQMLI